MTSAPNRLEASLPWSRHLSEPQFPYLYREAGHPYTHRHPSKDGKHLLGMEALLEQRQLLLGAGQSWGVLLGVLPHHQVCGLLYCTLPFTSKSTCAARLSAPYPGPAAPSTQPGTQQVLIQEQPTCPATEAPHPRPPQQTATAMFPEEASTQ